MNTEEIIKQSLFENKAITFKQLSFATNIKLKQSQKELQNFYKNSTIKNLKAVSCVFSHTENGIKLSLVSSDCSNGINGSNNGGDGGTDGVYALYVTESFGLNENKEFNENYFERKFYELQEIPVNLDFVGVCLKPVKPAKPEQNTVQVQKAPVVKAKPEVKETKEKVNGRISVNPKVEVKEAKNVPKVAKPVEAKPKKPLTKPKKQSKKKTLSKEDIITVDEEDEIDEKKETKKRIRIDDSEEEEEEDPSPRKNNDSIAINPFTKKVKVEKKRVFKDEKGKIVTEVYFEEKEVPYQERSYNAKDGNKGVKDNKEKKVVNNKKDGMKQKSVASFFKKK